MTLRVGWAGFLLTAVLASGQYADSEKEFQAALQRCEQSHCPELPAILNSLGGLYYELGRYGEAQPLLLRAVETLQQAKGDSRLLTAALGNLAAVYRVQGRLADAKPLYEQARLLQSGAGGDTLESARLQARLALLARDMGDLPAAAELIRRALAGLEINGASETADGAAALATWAAILESQRKPQQAEEQLRHVLAIRERLSIQNPILLGDALNTLGISYSHRSRWADAENVLRRAIEVLRTSPPSPALAASMNNLGSVLRGAGRGKEGESWIRQAIATWERLLGPNHPNVAAGLMNLAVSLQARGQYADAARLMERALHIDEQNFPAGDSRIGIDLSRAGALAKSRKRYREAEDLLLRAQAILEGALPASDPEIGAVLLNLADLFQREKKLEPSAGMYKRGLDIAASAWGASDPRLAPWLDGYVRVLRDQQDFAEAARLEAEATRIRVKQIVR